MPAAHGPLDNDAVKLLRRVDSEIREIAKPGIEALSARCRWPWSDQLLDAAAPAAGRERLDASGRLRPAQGDQADSLSLSGRQALVSAAAGAA
jgi:hypothetical protein